MTISTTVSRAEYAGNGVTTVFAFPYPFFADEDLTVLLLRTTGVVDTLMLNTDYTVSGEGTPSSGQVTLMTAPASGESLFILRELALSQETDYISGDPFPAESHERALDRLTLIDQQQQEQLSRSLTLNPTSSSGVSTELPVPQANALIGWNTDADGLQNYVGTSSALVSTAMEPVVAAATLADARSELGATVIGNALFTSANAAAARTTLELGAGADIASAATLDLSNGPRVRRLLNTTPITAITMDDSGPYLLTADAAAVFNVAGLLVYTCNPEDSVLLWQDGNGVQHAHALEVNLPGKVVGEVFEYAGTTAPAGALVCPTAQTNLSRTTYARLFAAIGTTWGAGDGSTTFGMPWFPANYASVQANGNVGTSTVGENLAHTHAPSAGGSFLSNGGGSGDYSGAGSNLRFSAATTSNGGSANLPAGVRMLKCVKY